MLDLDNLDLELEEGFSTYPLARSDLFEGNIDDTFAWSDNNINENSATNKSKNIKITPTKETKNDPVLKILESAEKEKKKENNNLFNNTLNLSNTFNTSFSPKIFCNNDNNDLNISKDFAKRLLTHRKFPGPAGLLPDKPLKDTSYVNVIIEGSIENMTGEGKKEAVILCSQTSSVFAEASFKKLASDFDLFKDNCPLNKYTVDWVKKRALKKTLFGKKIPFLAVVLHNLDHGTPDPVITLRDQTGEIYGTLHREVWSELGGKLQPGAALALRQVGVLITGIARRQVHLNITSNNIINIYSYSDEEIVETSCVNELDKNDLFRTANDWQTATSRSEQKVISNPFSTIRSSKSHYGIPSSKKAMTSYKAPDPNSRNSKDNFHHEHDRTLVGNISSYKIPKSKNCINFLGSMEDEFPYFPALLDESYLGEKSLGVKDSNKVANMERDVNIRKRKMDSEDINTLNKAHRPVTEEKHSLSNACGLPAKKAENQERFMISNKPLSQVESQIVEEVLDGLDFNDFDT